MIPPPAALRSLSEEQIERYARQIIVPGVGAEGQARLCSAEVFVDGHPDGRRIAARYLEAAGVRVRAIITPSTRLDCVVVAGVSDLSPGRLRRLVDPAPLIAWYTVAGRTVRGGLASTAHPISRTSAAHDVPVERPLRLAHRIAGADVATTALAALLGWLQPGESYDFELA
jgi:adenylyltransferase/sulfurtransferase